MHIRTPDTDSESGPELSWWRSGLSECCCVSLSNQYDELIQSSVGSLSLSSFNACCHLMTIFQCCSDIESSQTVARIFSGCHGCTPRGMFTFGFGFSNGVEPGRGIWK